MQFFRVFGLVFWGLLLARSGQAATFEIAPAWGQAIRDAIVSIPDERFFGGPFEQVAAFDQSFPHIHISGEIHEGDARRLRIILDRIGEGERIVLAVFSLDSPGGSYNEALKMSDMILEANASTLVWKGHRCLSACGLIFMGGYYEHRMVRHPVRYLHLDGALGFHAPYLSKESLSQLIGALLQDGRPTEKRLNTAVEQLLAVQHEAFSALVEQAVKTRLSSDFLANLIQHGAESFFYIDSISEAYNNRVVLVEDVAIQAPPMNEALGRRICRSAAINRNLPGVLSEDAFKLEGASAGGWSFKWWGGTSFGVSFCDIRQRDNTWFVTMRVCHAAEDIQNRCLGETRFQVYEAVVSRAMRDYPIH